MAAVGAGALSLAGGVVSLIGLTSGRNVVASLTAAVVLVAAAAVVGTASAHLALGIPLGVVPFSVLFFVASLVEGDAQSSLGWLMITMPALIISAAAWMTTFIVVRHHETSKLIRSVRQ